MFSNFYSRVLAHLYLQVSFIPHIFARIRTNIYDVCRTVSLALTDRPGAGSDAVRAQLDRFRTEWRTALEKAKQHDEFRAVAVEETKLAALEDIIAHVPEVTKA